MTDKQLAANHQRMIDPPPCKYGHFGCSCTIKEGGPCLDEVLSRIESREQEQQLKEMMS